MNYRKTLEDLAKNNYREAMRFVTIEKEKLVEMVTSQQANMRFYDQKAGTVVDVEMLMFVAKYTAQLANLMKLQEVIILEKEKVAEEKLNEWNIKRQEFEVVKRLKEKKWKLYLREAEKEEQKFQDEIFIGKKIRETHVSKEQLNREVDP